MSRRVLFLDAYHGDSHAAVSLGWRAHSRHRITVHTLPPHHWKWRLRSAGAAFAERIGSQPAQPWDAVVCTSMCDLAQWRALCPRRIAALPHVLYMHENQAVYPDPHRDRRDVHFPLTQWTACLGAEAVWWNSAWNRDSFLAGMQTLLEAMPDRHLPADWQMRIRSRSAVLPPGIDAMPAPRPQNPPLICWAARWEVDKRPDVLFQALTQLVDAGLDFRLALLGRRFARVPACFDQARERLAAQILHWGRCEDAADYRQLLAQGSIILSTAAHEFFGIALVEAAAAGCTPVVPHALAYPEVFAGTAHYHDGSAEDVARVLRTLITGSHPPAPARARMLERYLWPVRAADMDRALEDLCT